MLYGERVGGGEENTKEKERDEKQGDNDKEGDREMREMKLKSHDIKGRRVIFYCDFEPF